MLRARGLFPTTCLSSLKFIFRENKHIKLWHVHTQTLWVGAGVAQYGFQVLGSNDPILVSQGLSPLVCTTVLGEQDFSLAFHSLKKKKIGVCAHTPSTLAWKPLHTAHTHVWCGYVGAYGMACMWRSESYFVELLLSIHLYMVSRGVTQAAMLVYWVPLSAELAL